MKSNAYGALGSGSQKGRGHLENLGIDEAVF